MIIENRNQPPTTDSECFNCLRFGELNWANGRFGVSGAFANAVNYLFTIETDNSYQLIFGFSDVFFSQK